MTDNGKILSSQRSDEDQDLLERSTKKTKVNVGDPGLKAMDITMDSSLNSALGDPAQASADCLPEPQSPDVAMNAETTDVNADVVVPKTQMDSTDLSASEGAIPPGEGLFEVSVQDLPMGGTTVQNRTYLDSVVGSGSNTAPFLIANASESETLGEDDAPDPSEEDDDPTCPTIRLTDQEKERIREPWRKSLISKVMGRKITYLIVKQWVPNFDPMTDTTKKVLVWVRFPNLSVEYYNLLTLRKIGNKLGRTVQVDHTTSLVSRGKFARVCVEIDLTKPLISRFTLEEKVWQVAYEGMHLVCFTCGLYGHRREACSVTPIPANDTVVASEEQVTDHEHARTSLTRGGQEQRNLPRYHTAPYGSWMIVTRKDRRTPGGSGGQGRQDERLNQRAQPAAARTAQRASGSRFVHLDEESADVVPDEVVADRQGLSEQNNQPMDTLAANDSNAVPNSVRESTPTRGTTFRGAHPRRAVEEDEHVVVRGANGGGLIESTRVCTGEPSGAAESGSICPSPEHHRDPPEGLDHEGDVVMDIEDNSDDAQRCIVWNYQGAGGRVFHRVLSNLIQTHKPTILGLVEPKVSGSQANAICSKLGFSDWVRVEAVGFSGGIWIFWNDSINVVVTSTHPQFVILQRSSEFTDWIHSEGLVDLGFSSPKLTWIKSNQSDLIKGARLDRAMCNISWRHRFPEATVTHLPQVSSDHAPILVRTVATELRTTGAPFRFQAAWLTDQRVVEVVRNSWCSNLHFMDNIPSVTVALSDWNRTVFGNIFHRKKIVLARLEGVQRRYSTNPHRGIVRLEQKLIEEYQTILHQEELLWYQRSREDWILSGDRNTKYYHLAAAIRKSRNSISSLRLDNGEWITDPANLKAHDITPAEVHCALFDIAPFKAPGLDGLHAAFFPRMWDVVGVSLCDFVKSAIHTGVLPEGVNDTILTLIPRIIMNCIRSSRLSVNWNGERLPQLRPARGIRQGDPMSPAIFVLGMEKLSQMITLRTNSGEWKGVQLALDCPILSHLYFADDMVLFAEASIEQVAVIQDCLSRFCEVSGQRVSYAKS
ncbi:uncharacterized protein LOC116033288 [Ipomoea triloba]|uniref:uncharacterized protein LOC116033288 n=1 Tax=Ipomoea triloba TaxID=35885 RepID=UPI00125E8983|nr:uncharacterized protein LOC116033288 [Ipomoea triloba]